MKRRIVMMGISAVAAAILSACGGDGGKPAPPPPPASMGLALTTAQVLDRARQSSETTEPLPVNGGALALTDTSESADSISVVGP